MEIKNHYFFIIIYIFLLFNFILFGCDKNSNSPEDNGYNGITENLDPFEQNKLLGRSVNLGNALEAPNEGEWGVTLKQEYFQLIKDAGFEGVRIPIRWSTHAADSAPYKITDSFFARVDWAIEQSFDNGLAAVINIHHYEEIMQQPEKHKARFLGLWEQIAAHYQKYPKELFFEILNEPNDKLTPELWNNYLKDAINVIRESNPRRTLIVGTAGWGGISALDALAIPEDDQNVIATIHYYNPFHFTHQGAEWVEGSDEWLGTRWIGSASEKNDIVQELDYAAAWATEHNRPLFMGEFGAYSKADMNSRFLWTQFVAREAEKREMSWSYWEFCSGFGVYDQSKNDWNSLLLLALIP